MDPAQNPNQASQPAGGPPPDNPPASPLADQTTPTTPPPEPPQFPEPPEPGPFPPGESDGLPQPGQPPQPTEGLADTPPPIITPPSPSRSKAKIVGSILAVLILVVSIPAGIFLVQRSQEIREKACDPEVEDCEPEPEPGEPEQLPPLDGTPSCSDDVEYCDGTAKIHKHGGSWNGSDCVYAFDRIGSCEEQPQCTDDLEYCDQEKGRQIHKHGGFWDEDKEQCVYAFDDKGVCPDTRAHCSTAGFWCANNAVQCGAPHKRHPEFACDLPEQACCQIVSGGPQPPTGQCANVKAYDDKWNQLTANALSALKAGESVRFAIGGSATNGSIDKARFKVNTSNFEETSQKNPTGEFFVLFIIPAGTNSFNIDAQLHHTNPSIDWF